MRGKPPERQVPVPVCTMPCKHVGRVGTSLLSGKRVPEMAVITMSLHLSMTTQVTATSVLTPVISRDPPNPEHAQGRRHCHLLRMGPEGVPQLAFH